MSREKSLAVLLVVEFLKSVDFQRRYDAFSETSVQKKCNNMPVCVALLTVTAVTLLHTHV